MYCVQIKIRVFQKLRLNFLWVITPQTVLITCHVTVFFLSFHPISHQSTKKYTEIELDLFILFHFHFLEHPYEQKKTTLKSC